jgi:outer membrane protein assembly factor BamB
VFHQGTLLVAPADSPRILAFDAATGQMLWRTDTSVDDALHLLGTGEDHLIAGGGKLYWINLAGERRGQIAHVWPDGPETPGFGRGVLAGGEVLWPAERRIYVFDRQTAQPKKVIDLAARGARGGNLLVTADGRLLIATPTELIALRRYSTPTRPNGDTIARRHNLPDHAMLPWNDTVLTGGSDATLSAMNAEKRWGSCLSQTGRTRHLAGPQ